MPGLGKNKIPRCVELRAAGFTFDEIAADLGCNRATVYQTVRKPAVAALVDAVHQETRTLIAHRVANYAEKALKGLLDIAESKGTAAETRRKIYVDILDRAGTKAATKTEVSGPSGAPVQVQSKLDMVGMTPEQIRALVESL